MEALAASGVKDLTIVKGKSIAQLPNWKAICPPFIEALVQPGRLELAEEAI